LADVSRRKSNIVGTGIPKSTTISDERAFFTLCEENFSFKPNLSHLGWRRLGKGSTAPQQPRKLLVHLASEQATTDILADAKKLRKSDNPAVATAVYIQTVLQPKQS